MAWQSIIEVLFEERVLHASMVCVCVCVGGGGESLCTRNADHRAEEIQQGIDFNLLQRNRSVGGGLCSVEQKLELVAMLTVTLLNRRLEGTHFFIFTSVPRTRYRPR